MAGCCRLAAQEPVLDNSAKQRRAGVARYCWARCIWRKFHNMHFGCTVLAAPDARLSHSRRRHTSSSPQAHQTHDSYALLLTVTAPSRRCSASSLQAQETDELLGPRTLSSDAIIRAAQPLTICVEDAPFTSLRHTLLHPLHLLGNPWSHRKRPCPLRSTHAHGTNVEARTH